MRVVKTKSFGVVSSVALHDRDGAEVVPVCRFLQHILDSGGSPNTASAYGFDLKNLFEFLEDMGMDWQDFRPAVALNFLGWLRKRPSRRPAQRLGLAVTGPEGRQLAAATVARVLAAVSSFYEWAIVAELFEAENPTRRQPDPALARVAERHRPFTGGASRQQPVRRQIRVKLPLRLPRPLCDSDVEALLGSMTCGIWPWCC